MPRSLLPPRGIFVATPIIFSRDLPSQVKETFLQLLALAWGSAMHETPALSMPQLAELTGKSQATLYGHIAIIRTFRDALRLRPAGNGLFVLQFAGWLFSRRPFQDSENLESLYLIRNQIKEEEVFNSDTLFKDLNPPPHFNKDQAIPENWNPLPAAPTEAGEAYLPGAHLAVAKKAGTAKPPRDRSQKGRFSALPAGVGARAHSSRQFKKSGALPAGSAPDLPPAALEGLRKAGVFSALFPEVAASGFNEEDLLALIAWAAADNPQRPGGLITARLRRRQKAPDCYYQPPCSICGQYGGHDPQCRARYLLSGYGLADDEDDDADAEDDDEDENVE
jgi:hypothetical protein